MKGEKNSYRNVNDKDRNVKDLHPDRKLQDIEKNSLLEFMMNENNFF